MKRIAAALLCIILLAGFALPLGAGARVAPQSIGKVSGLKATATTATAVKIVWNSVKGASGYQVCLSLSKTSGYKKVLTLSGAGTTAAVVKNLKPSTRYYLAVRAFKGSTAGKFSITAATTKKAKAGIATKTNVELVRGRVYTQFDFTGNGQADAFKIAQYAATGDSTIYMNGKKIQVIEFYGKAHLYYVIAPTPKLCFLVHRIAYSGGCYDELYRYKGGKFQKVKDFVGEYALCYVDKYVVSPTAVNVVISSGKYQRDIFGYEDRAQFYLRYAVSGGTLVLKSRLAPAYGQNIYYANREFQIIGSDDNPWVSYGSRVEVTHLYLANNSRYSGYETRYYVQTDDGSGWLVPNETDWSEESLLY
ncbi:MAG: fibronectin type III domain-containing protein [Clostridia bacterium]|nr:fibronectin type III domain-containing protein [Clostridia bacterium]